MTPKRLLQINVAANWGSTGRICEGIGEAALADGWESYVAYGRYALPSRSQLIKIGGKWDQAWHLLQSRLLDRHGLASAWATRQFVKQIEDIKPDVVHLHNIHGYYLNYPILFDYLKRWGGPVVWTLHDCWPFTGHCAHYDFARCDRWQRGCHHCPQRHSYPAAYLDRSRENYELKRKAFSGMPNLTIVPVSDWLKGEVEKSFLGCYEIKRIYNGVDLATFRPTDRKFSILGVASVWNERKGLADFVRLREMLPLEEVDITLVGLAGKQIATLPPGIKGIERTTSIRELVQLYSNCDVYVNTSKEETLGMTTIEAQLCGTPVIAYNATAIAEGVASQQAGRIVEPGDVAAIAVAVNDLRQGRWKPDVEEMRNAVAEKFEKQDRYAEYISTYSDITKFNTGGGKNVVIGVASVWSKRKGLDDFIALRRQLPGEVGMVLVGLTKKQIAALPAGITGIERTNSIDQLRGLYAGALALVNPTWEDNFPTTNLEALACGTPVITYRTGGSPEAIDPETGIVVEQGDIEGLADAIGKIIAAGREHYTDKCRTRAIEHYDKCRCFSEYVKLYEKLSK